MNKCNLNFVDPVTLDPKDKDANVESFLHKQLRDRYQFNDSDGNSSYYTYIRTSPDFMEAFGNWTDPDTYKRLIEETKNMGVFNFQREPQLYYNHLGPYVLTPTGDFHYLEGARPSMSSKDYIDGANALTGQYIEDTSGIELGAFVENKINARITELEKKVVELKAKRSVTKRMEYIKNLGALNTQLDKLRSLINNKTILKGFVKRISNRIDKSNIKLVEDVIDIEEVDTNSEIVEYNKDSNETSNRAYDDIEILKFVASVPQYEQYHEDMGTQEQYRKINPLFGDTLYMNPSAVRSIIEDILSDVIITKDNEDMFDLYLEKMKDAAQFSQRPEINYIYNFLKDLENRVPDAKGFKTKFFTAMHKAKQIYAITILENDKQGGLKIDILDPALTNDKIGKITNNFIERIVTVEGREDLARIKANALLAFEKLEATTQSYVDFLNKLLLDDLKLQLDPRTIPALVYGIKKQKDFSALNSLLRQFLSDEVTDSDLPPNLDPVLGEMDVLKSLDKVSARNKNAPKYKSYLMRSKSFFKILGSYESYYRNKNSQATVYVGKKQRWLYSFVSNLQLQIAKLKRGDYTRLNQLEGRNFTMVKHLMKDPKNVEALHLITNTELKRPTDPNPVLHKRITTVDAHIDNFIKMFYSKKTFFRDTTGRKQGLDAEEEQRLLELKNYLVYNFGADKNSLFSILGLPRPDSGKANLYNPGTKELGTDFKVILRDYVLGEINKSIKESEVVEEYMNLPEDQKTDYLMKNLIPGYHYNTKKNVETEHLTFEDFQAGSYHKLGVFTSSFNKYLKKNSTVVYGKDKGLVPVIRKNFTITKSFDALMNIVYDDINQLVKKNYDQLNNITLINTIADDGTVTNKKLFDIATNINFSGSKDLALYSYIISSFIVGYEFSNMFNGHIGYYKQTSNEDLNLSDFLKRGPATASNGMYPYMNKKDTTKKTYKTFSGEEVSVNANQNTVVAVIDDISPDKSKFASLISTAMGKQLAYSHEVSDGQGFITPEHFRNLVERIYGWTKEDQEMFDELTDRNHEVSLKNIKWLTKYSKSFTPLKLTYFNNNVQSEEQKETGEGEGIPVFFKYSTATLFPALISGSQGERLLNQMHDQGVEQVVFKSGSKASNFATTKVHTDKDGIFTGIKEQFKFNPFTIDTEMLKVQTQVPTKLTGSITLGNQVIKNMLVNLDITDPKPLFNWDGKMLTSKEMYDLVDSTLKNILQFQLDETLKQLGFDKTELTFNKKNVKRFLKGQLDIETETDILNLLDTDLPLETIPNFTQRVFPVISSYINKNAGKVYTNGSSVVQVANVGFDRVTDKEKNQILFFENEKRELTPPIPKTFADLTKAEKDEYNKLSKKDPAPDSIIYWNEDGNITLDPKEGKMRIRKARILLPFTGLFKNNEISYEDFIKMWKEGKIDKELFLNSIGYRIPNQAKASIDSFEIVGILPPISGDQAIVYHEITAKTGSDFDIDKMYMMLPAFRTPGKIDVIPEEHKGLLKEVEKELGNKVPPIDNYNTLSWLKKRSGNSILKTLLDNDDNFREYLEERYPYIGNKDLEKPISPLLNHFDELLEELEKENNYIIDSDGSHLYLAHILTDVKNSHDKRYDDITDIKKEKRKRIKAIYKKYGRKKATKIEYIPSSEDSKNGNKNKLIELYSAILESQATYDDLMSPLDNPIIKNTINKVLYLKANPDNKTPTETEVKEWTEQNKPSGLEQLFPFSLTKSRIDVLEAKSLIAIMANNMTDLGESQKVGFKIKHPIGLTTIDMGRIYQIGEPGNSDAKISKIVSYGMNATVDAAKDAYIVDGNFTTYTANAGIMMVRLGLNLEDIFTILSNDTIVEFSIDKINARAKAANIATDYNVEQLDKLAETFISKLLEKKTDDVFDIISRDDFLYNTTDKKELILGFWHLLQETAKEFNNSVVAMKSDSNGPGKNLASMVAYRNRIERQRKDAILNAGKKWFKNGLTEENMKFDPNINNNPDAKFLGVMANNTLFLMEELSSQLFLEASPKVVDTINAMSAQLDNPLPTDEGSIKLLYNYLYPYLLYKTNHRLYRMTETYDNLNEEEWLLEEFPKEVQKKRDETDNDFLKELIISTKSKDEPIRFNNAEAYSEEETLLFKEAIIDLMEKDMTFVDNLVKYSYLTTGFKSTTFSFHQYFPASYFVKKFHGRAVQDFIENNTLGIDPAHALSLIAMNNHNNFKIVKKKPKQNFKTIRHPNYGIIFTVEDQKLYDKLVLKNTKELSFYPFVKSASSLYKLIDIEDGKPLYDSMDINDTTIFKSYNYNLNTKRGINKKTQKAPLLVSDLSYQSKVKKFFKDDSDISSKETFNKPVEIVDIVKTTSGRPIREFMTQKEWDNTSPEEQQKIIDCN